MGLDPIPLDTNVPVVDSMHTDREAQRAIRERQRTRIEQYEREIAELKSQRSYQDLAAALQETAAAKAEAEHLRRVLASVVGIIQPVLHADQPPPTPPDQPAPQPAPPPPPSYSGSTASPSSAATPLRWPDTHHHPPSPSDPVLTALSQQHQDPHVGLDFRVALHSPSQIPPLQCAPHGGPLDTGTHNHSLPKPPPLPPSAPSPSPIPTSPPSCPFDELLHLCLLEHRHHLLTSHHPPTTVLGPPYPSVSSLLNPASSPHAHPLSRIFTDIIARFPSLRPLPERVAVLWIMFHLLRWELCPTPENLARVPAWLRPGRAQMGTAHPAWINYLPWPRLREALVGFWTRDPGGCRLEEFFVPFTTTLSVNWGYEDVDALLRVPPPRGGGEGEGEEGVGEVLINPVFERHIGRLDNWTVGDAFYDAFPELGGTFHWKSERAGGVVVRVMEEEEGEGREGGGGEGG